MSNRKKAMVTGASEGIGRAFAVNLAEQGYDVTLVARSEERLRVLVAELPSGEHQHRVVDLASEDGMRQLAQELQPGAYDLLVNNAGVSIFGQFHELDFEGQQAMIRLNCQALACLSHAFLLNAPRGAALLNVASIVGFFSFPTQAVYAASKSFVLSLTEALWYEQKARGVFVMAVCPGSTATTFFDRAGIEQGPPKGITQTPEQVVNAALAALAARRHPVRISGVVNALLTRLPRLLPRRAMVNIIGLGNPLES